MDAIQPRYSADEFKTKGDALYEEVIRPRLTDEDHGKFVAIDVEGRGYEIAPLEREACESLKRRVPDAQIWLKRVGYRAPYRFGWRGTFGRTDRPTSSGGGATLRYPMEQIASRGNAIFAERIAGSLQSSPPQDFVAIDIETGDFEVAADQLVAVSRLRARSQVSDPQIWVRRVGPEVSHRIGGQRREAP